WLWSQSASTTNGLFSGIRISALRRAASDTLSSAPKGPRWVIQPAWRPNMIKRIWNGWTTRESADAYEQLLDTFVFPGIEEKKLPGYRSIELMKRDLGDEVQFTTVMCFDSLASVIAFR